MKDKRKLTKPARADSDDFVKVAKKETTKLAVLPETKKVTLLEPVAELEPVKEVPKSIIGSEAGYGDDSAFSLYMREVGQTALLTPAEEIMLAKRIKKGDAEARERMIKAN